MEYATSAVFGMACLAGVEGQYITHFEMGLFLLFYNLYVYTFSSWFLDISVCVHFIPMPLGKV